MRTSPSDLHRLAHRLLPRIVEAPDERPLTASDREAKINRAKRELRQVVDGLPDGARVNVLFFSEASHPAFEQAQPLDEETRASIESHIDRTVPHRGTKLGKAMERALSMEPDQIVVLTDGHAADTRRVMKLWMSNKARPQIDTIGLGHDHDQGLLLGWAQRTKGRYVSVATD